MLAWRREGGVMADLGVPATMCEAFQATAARYPDELALRTAGGAVMITWGDYAGRPQRQLIRVPRCRRLERLAHRRRDTQIPHHGPLSRRRAGNRDPAAADGNHPGHLMKPL